MKTEHLASLKTVKKILAPTDLSPNSRSGVQYALTAARDLGAAVIVYYVVTGNEIVKPRRRRNKERLIATDFNGVISAYKMPLESFLQENFARDIRSVKVDKKVEFGTPETSIVKKAKTEGVDLIVMATRGMTGLSRLVLGSVTERVIRNAPCPVVVVPLYSRSSDHRRVSVGDAGRKMVT
jgi:nucleotide-binding universal stress UspA family protein